MKFVVIGTGNVAWHLVDLFLKSGHQCNGAVASGLHEGAQQFAAHFQINLLASTSRIPSDSDVVFLAVPDARIALISQKINATHFIVHTSGMTPLGAIENSKRAVMWPLLSLTKGILPQASDWNWVLQSDVPEAVEQLQKWLPEGHRTLVTQGDTDRQKMHLAAVFANNFVNHLYHISSQLLPQDTESSFGLLLPLLKGHIYKLEHSTPYNAQTGPARRRDFSTLAAHRQLLNKNPELLSLYNDFTQRITDLYEHHEL
jgi:predicted short-subunit dehydrogenase-like oxidoreductase (DUF2520 family)